MNDITIIIPTRANVEYLTAAVESIRTKKQYDDCKILIGADNPTEEVRDYLENNQKGKFDFAVVDQIRKESGKTDISALVIQI